MTDINEDGFTGDEIEAALNILSVLKERANNNGEEHEYADISQTAYYLRNYQETSEWRQERPSDRIDTSKNKTLTESVGSAGDG